MQSLDAVGVRILFVGDENIGRVLHQLGEVAVRIERRGNGHIRADHFANASEEIAFAVVVVLRNHCAVQREDDGVQRQGGAHTGDDFVAQCFIHFANHRARRLCLGTQAFGQFVTVRFGETTKLGHHVAHAIGRTDAGVAPVDPVLLKSTPSRGARRECVRFGGKVCREDLHCESRGVKEVVSHTL